MTDTAKKAAAPAAPAKKAAAPKVTLDLTALTVTDVDDAELKHEKGSKYDNSPVKAWLVDSFENDKVKAVPVPSPDHADALEVALRGVAARLKIGVKIVVKPADPKKPNGEQIVKFRGQERRKYTAKAATAPQPTA